MSGTSQAPRFIDLRRSRRARAFEPDESFWETQIARLMTRLEHHHLAWEDGKTPSGQRTYATPRERTPDHQPPPTLALAILGERGSGKSSMLRTFLSRLVEEKSPLQGKVYVLPAVDPTLLSQYDNFLHAFLAQLLEVLEKLAGKNDVSLHELRCRSSLQKLADHLWVVNGGPPQEEDRVAGGLERLDRHRSGPVLKRLLEGFFDDVSCDLASLRSPRSGSDAGALTLVLPVDDPDMAFDQFTSTLEIYRRYLRHSRLVPVFAFSKTLALELLTLYFGRHFGHQRRVPRGEGGRTVRALAAQFLDKLLPPQDRVSLELPQRMLLERSFRSEIYQDQKGYPVKELLCRTCRVLFGDEELWERILPGSLRRQIQLVDALQGQLPKKENTESFEQVARAFLEVHSAGLAEIGVQVEDLLGTAAFDRGPLLLRQVLDSFGRSGEVGSWREGELKSLLLSLMAVYTFRPEAPQFASAELPATSRAAADAWGWRLRLLSGFHLPLRLRSVPAVRIQEEGWTAETLSRRLVTAVGAGESFPGLAFVHPGGRIGLPEGNGKLWPHSFAGLLYREAWRGSSCGRWLDVRVQRNPELAHQLEAFPGLAGLLEMGQHDLPPFVAAWCHYGSNPQPWAALCLWRGLALLSRVLEKPPNDKKKAEDLLRWHLEATVVTDSTSFGRPEGVELIWLGASSSRGTEPSAWALGDLPKQILDWWKKASKLPSALDKVMQFLQGWAVEERLLIPLSMVESRLPLHSRAGGRLLQEWLRRVEESLPKDDGLRQVFCEFPLVKPLLQEESGKRLLAYRPDRSADASPTTPVDHDLGLQELLDLLIPADYPRYFALFRERLAEIRLKYRELV